MADGTVGGTRRASADAVRRRAMDRPKPPADQAEQAQAKEPRPIEGRPPVDEAQQAASRERVAHGNTPRTPLASPDDARPLPDGTLRRGSRGPAVRQLQDMLRARGHDPGETDGRFGTRTEQAVRAFQRERGLRGDGVVGDLTRGALNGGTRAPAQPTPAQPTPAQPTPAQPTPGANPTGPLGTSYRDYQQRLQNGVQIEPRVRGQVDTAMQRIEQNRELIDQIARRADVPRELVAALWFRENSAMRSDVYLHNGERLGSPTTLVPRGIFFRRDQFVDAAVHALNQKRGLRDQLGLRYGSRDVAAMAAYAEGYNGFGYRNRGVTSAYVASGTPLYTGGQYIRDGVFSRTARDPRPGVLPIISEMMRRGL